MQISQAWTKSGSTSKEQPVQPLSLSLVPQVMLSVESLSYEIPSVWQRWRVVHLFAKYRHTQLAWRDATRRIFKQNGCGLVVLLCQINPLRVPQKKTASCHEDVIWLDAYGVVCVNIWAVPSSWTGNQTVGDETDGPAPEHEQNERATETGR